jgi:hypothetical protein
MYLVHALRRSVFSAGATDCDGNRIRMYAGPVSLVSNYKHWL